MTTCEQHGGLCVNYGHYADEAWERAPMTDPIVRRALQYLDEQVREAGSFMLREPSPDLDRGDQDPPERAVLLIREALQAIENEAGS